MSQLKRILLTGAAGGLGTVLRKPLRAMAQHLRLSDRKRPPEPAHDEEIVACDVADAAAVLALTRDVDMLVHLGGAVGADLSFDEVLQANVLGLKNIYEACRRNGVKRVIWGSSNHAFGFYPRAQRIDAATVPRPDSFYGVSKVFGEAMAQYYWDKFQLQSVSMRIGSCFPKPTDLRMLSTWQSYPDFVHLVQCCLRAPAVGHTIVYGVSNNDSRLWDNHMAEHLGYRPKDNAEVFRAEIEATAPVYRQDDPQITLHGGSYAAAGHTHE
jgi:uronate dehydrogenase